MSTLFDILSIILVIPIATIIFDASSSGVLSNLLVSLENFQIFSDKKNFLLVFIIIFVIKTFLTIFIYRYISKIRLDLKAKLRIDLINKYNLTEYNTFRQKLSSHHIQTITSAVSVFSNCLMSFLRIISESIIILFIILYLVFLDSKLILTVLPIFILFVLINHIIFKKRLINLGNFVNKTSKDVIQIVTDFVKGIKEIKISKKESFFISVFKKKADDLAKNELSFEVILFTPRYFLEVFFIILIIGFLFVNFNILSTGESEKYIILLASYLYATLRLLPSISIIARMTSILNNGVNFVESLYNDLVSESPKDVISRLSNDENIKKWQFKNLEFKDVSFSYNKKDLVLNKLNLEINSAESILITGPSGSGKSTTVDLILGFFKPVSGEILVNKNNTDIIKFINNSYYISQNKFLFNGTIFNNIVLDKNKSSYKDLNDEEKVIFDKALKISRLEEIVNNKIEKLDFYIGEGGNNLSGGQRQRISIARSLYSNREILIFDEATSELDKNLEEEIFFELSKLSKIGKTIIVISHSNVIGKYFNKIFKLQNGSINNY
ncbi:ABC transporter ATP-binding protein [Pelagibacterales bacterium SAG-MED47]|nr:ABC transporter ATP-binding protein [Pelagibacterales bacterium SAG-MED47]